MRSAPGVPRVSRFVWSDTVVKAKVDPTGQVSRAQAPAVLIASADPVMRERLRGGLAGIHPVREVAQRGDLERMIATLAPDVLLLDVDLLRLGGIGDGPVVRALSKLTRVVMLSGAPNDREGIRVLKAGARGYCHRDQLAGPLLRKAIDRVRDGEIWAERKLIAQLLEEYSADPGRTVDVSARSDSRLEMLTPREREISRLIGAGASNKEIAHRLGVGEGTVKAHLTAIFRKLGFTDRLQLGLFLVNPGIQPPTLRT